MKESKEKKEVKREEEEEKKGRREEEREGKWESTVQCCVRYGMWYVMVCGGMYGTHTPREMKNR